MQKIRTLYVWEGPDTIAITKGGPMEECGHPHQKKVTVKHKGLFTKPVCFNGIPDTLIGSPKNLFLGKIVPGWQAIKIHLDINTWNPFTPDLAPVLLNKISMYEHEIESLKRKLMAAERLNIDREQKDRYRERVKKDAKFMQEVKGYSGGFNDMFGSPFSGFNRFQPPGEL